MKYLDTKKDSLEEASFKAINEKPDSSKELKEANYDIKFDSNEFGQDDEDDYADMLQGELEGKRIRVKVGPGSKNNTLSFDTNVPKAKMIKIVKDDLGYNVDESNGFNNKVNAKDLEEAGGKYLKYSDLLLQKGRMLAKNKNTAMIDREIEKEKRKLGIQDEFDAKMQEMAVVMEAEGDKEKYQKFFRAALKKFGVDSPADFKSDEEKKKFFNYVDKNYKGDHEEEVDIEESKMGALFLDMQTDAQEMSLNDFIKKHRGQMGMSPDELKRMHKEFNEEVDLEEADAHVLLDVERGDRDFENFVKKNRLKTKMSVKDVNPGYDELEITGDKRAIEKLLKLRGEDWLKFNPRRNWFEESNKLIKASVQAITDAESVDLEEADIKMTDQVFDSGKQFKDFFKFMKSKFRLSLKGKVTPGENGDDFTLSGSDTNIIKYLRYLDDGGTLYLQMYKKKGNVYVGEEVDLEKKLNDNVEETLDKIREANVQKGRTMRSILADIWNVKEGKNPFEKVKKEASSKKTLTGKKPTAVEIEPKIE